MIVGLVLLLAGCANYGSAQVSNNGFFFGNGGQQGTFITPLGSQPAGPVTTNVGFVNQVSNLGISNVGNYNPTVGGSFFSGAGSQTGFGTGFAGGFGASTLGPYSAAFLALRGLGTGTAFNPSLLSLAGAKSILPPGILSQTVKEDPRTLTCFRLNKYTNSPTKVMAVTVSEELEANPYSFLPLFQSSAKPKGLSLIVEAFLPEVYGAAKIVITERGALSAGCNAASLGPIVSLDDGHGQQSSFLSLPFLNPYGRKDKENGVVASITLLPDRKSAVHVDNLGPGFKDLPALAGRGVALVSTLDTDPFGRSSIRGEALFCCSLEWDNQHRSLHEEYHKRGTPESYDGKGTGPVAVPPKVA